MARRRWIDPDIWTDPSITKLTPMERLMFIGCFSNADDEGRLLGSPAILRSMIFPTDDVSLAEIEAMRNHILEACKNLVLYEVDGVEYLAFLKWERYQKPDHPKPSKYPPPPSGANQSDQPRENIAPEERKESEDIAPGLGRDGLGRVGMGERAPESARTDLAGEKEAEPPAPCGAFSGVIASLWSVKGYPKDQAKDELLLASLAAEFPEVDLAEEARKWAVYKLDHPLDKKSNPRSQFRTWVKKAREWGGYAQRASPAAHSDLDAHLRELDELEARIRQEAANRAKAKPP